MRMYKRAIGVVFCLLFLVSTGRAYAAVEFSTDTTLSLSGSGIALIATQGSNADEVTVNANSVEVTVTYPDVLTIRSDDKYQLTTTPSLSNSCSATSSWVTIAPASGTTNVTITVGGETATCATASTVSQTTTSSSTGHVSSSFCSYVSAPSSPMLFQIKPIKGGARLFFSPVLSDVDRYYISYGEAQDALGHGVEIYGNSTGVISVDILDLRQNTRYYFKVRTGNRCAPGGWSNILSFMPAQRLPSISWKNTLTKVVNTTIQNGTDLVKPKEQVTVSYEAVLPPAATPSPQPSPVVNPSTDATKTGTPFLQAVSAFVRRLFGMQ